jgi:hypothetical protein
MALTIAEVAQGMQGIHALRIWRPHTGSSGSIRRRDGIHTNGGSRCTRIPRQVGYFYPLNQ